MAIKLCQQKVIILFLLVTYWSSWSNCAVIPPQGSLRSYITGGFKGVQSRNLRASLDCSQYANDYEVLYYLPFLIMINPMSDQWKKSTAQMDDTNTFVTSIDLWDANSTVPESVFCLKKLNDLTIDNMKFINDIVPDSLGNLKRLSKLFFQKTRISNITSQLTTLRYLKSLWINQCELPQLPNLGEMENLQNIFLAGNRLSQILGLNGPDSLALQNNNFTELPTLTKPENLHFLSMADNPLKHIIPLNSFINLQTLELSNTPITFIPPTIEKLQNLRELSMSYTKLSYLPQNILKLTKLNLLSAQGNPFDTNELSSIRQKFNQTLPNCTLYL